MASKAKKPQLSVKLNLAWVPRFVLAGSGVQWAVVEQCTDERSPDVGKWSCFTGGAYQTNGSENPYCFATSEAAMSHAQKAVRKAGL